MKKKILGIFVCMLLIATMAIPISALNKEHIPNIEPISKDADVPVWEVGDTWTYNMELYIAASPNVTDDMIADISGELVYEVIEDTGDTYKLTGTMSPMMGMVDLPGIIDMRVTRLSSYASNLEVHKTDLSIINHYFLMKGIVLLTLGPIPLPIPLQMQFYRATEFDPPWEILPFPLYDGDAGTYVNTTITEETETSLFWGLIPIAQDDDIEWHLHDVEYTCNFESITVEAGDFDVFNVTGHLSFGVDGHDWYRSYYAEEVGNMAKSVTHIEYTTEETYYNMEMELKSTTYTP